MAFLGIDYFDDKGKYIFLIKRDLYTNKNSFKPNELNDSNIIILSATEEFTRTDTASISEYPVSSGNRHTDHYRVNPATVSFRGVIAPKLLSVVSGLTSLYSDRSLQSLKATVTNYIGTIRDVMLSAIKGDSQSGQSPLFTVYLPDNNTIETCVITSFSISRDSKVSDGYYVDITVQEVFFADTDYSIVPLNDSVTNAAATSSETGQDYGTDRAGELTGDSKANLKDLGITNI